MKRLLVVCSAAAALLTFGIGPASAAEPTEHGCVGFSISGNAQARQPYGATFVSIVAPRSGLGSIGEGIQLIQAGLIPDGIYPNTCNP